MLSQLRNNISGWQTMTEQTGTSTKKPRGMAQRSLDLIEAMYEAAEAVLACADRCRQATDDVGADGVGSWRVQAQRATRGVPFCGAGWSSRERGGVEAEIAWLAGCQPSGQRTHRPPTRIDITRLFVASSSVPTSIPTIWATWGQRSRTVRPSEVRFLGSSRQAAIG
jgi:hypothetical protein